MLTKSSALAYIQQQLSEAQYHCYLSRLLMQDFPAQHFAGEWPGRSLSALRNRLITG